MTTVLAYTTGQDVNAAMGLTIPFALIGQWIHIVANTGIARMVALIDFNDSDNNIFRAVNQFTVEYTNNGQIVTAAERTDATSRETELCGYFIIITSKKMIAKEALLLYKSRDASEKLFRGDKSYLGNKVLRVYSSESAESKIFIKFVVLIIRNRIYRNMKEYMLENDVRRNYLDVPEALRELEKIEMIRYSDRVYRLSHAVTSTQKTILRAFGLDE